MLILSIHSPPYRCVQWEVFFLAEIASKIGSSRNKKIYLTLHGGRLPEFFINKENRFQKLFGRATIIFSPSKFIQKFFQEKKFTIKYLYNSIDLEVFSFSSTKRKPFSILWVRGFQSIYNPHIAIYVMEQILKVHPTASLTMIGPDLGLKEDCERLIEEKQLSNSIKILGSVKNNELPKYLQSHEVFINTTSYESFGVALLEAAACGIPIVSSSVGEIPLLWEDRKNILLVQPVEPDYFVEKIFQIFESNTLSNSLSINARKKAEQYDWKITRQKWLEVFNAPIE